LLLLAPELLYPLEYSASLE
jgi:hypothetical protein